MDRTDPCALRLVEALALEFQAVVQDDRPRWLDVLRDETLRRDLRVVPFAIEVAFRDGSTRVFEPSGVSIKGGGR